MRGEEENGRWNVRRDIYIGSFALQGPSITIPAAQITRVFRVFSTTPLRFLRLVSWRTQCTWWTVPRRRVNNPERLMRVRRKAVAQHGLPFVRGKSAKSWIRKWIFFILPYNCMSLSRILTMSNIIAIYDIRKINLKGTWCSNEAERCVFTKTFMMSKFLYFCSINYSVLWDFYGLYLRIVCPLNKLIPNMYAQYFVVMLPLLMEKKICHKILYEKATKYQTCFLEKEKI